MLKLSAGTACWPCRQRKVKCDNKQPCENCVKRDHANLCSYNPKNAKASTGSVAGIKRPRSPGTGSDSSFKKDEDRWPRTTGTSRLTKLPDVIARVRGSVWSGSMDWVRGPLMQPLARDLNHSPEHPEYLRISKTNQDSQMMMTRMNPGIWVRTVLLRF